MPSRRYLLSLGFVLLSLSLSQDGVPQMMTTDPSVTSSTSSSGTNTMGVMRIEAIAKEDPPLCEIFTIAGNGKAGYSGDGGPGLQAMLKKPEAVTVDSTGNVYIADTGNNRVRKVDPNGVITTVAGNGETKPPLDTKGTATEAPLYGPKGVVTDKEDNLYIADTFNGRIHKLVTSGEGAGFMVPIVKYPGFLAYVPALTLNRGGENNFNLKEGEELYFIESSRVSRFRWVFGDYPVVGEFAGPEGIAADSQGNLYVAETKTHRIQKIGPPANRAITTVAGNGTAGISGNCGPATAAQLDSPQGVAVDSNDNLYIADTGNHRIRKVNPEGIISILAGSGGTGYSGDGGVATSASLNKPEGVAVDSKGNVYIADTQNNRIRMVVCPVVATTPEPSPSPSSTFSLSPLLTKTLGSLGLMTQTSTSTTTTDNTSTSTNTTSTNVSYPVVDSTFKPVMSVMGIPLIGDQFGLSFTIKPELASYTFKPDLFTDQTVKFTASVTNNNQEPVTFSFYHLANMKLTEESIRKNGKDNLPIVWRDSVAMLYPPPDEQAARRLLTLQPGAGETFDFYGVVNCYPWDVARMNACLVEEPEPPRCREFLISKPGDYRLQFSYHYDGIDNSLPNVFHETLISPEVIVHAQ